MSAFKDLRSLHGGVGQHVWSKNAGQPSEGKERSLRLIRGFGLNGGGQAMGEGAFENRPFLPRPRHEEIESFVGAVDFGDRIAGCPLKADRHTELKCIHFRDPACFSGERAGRPDVSEHQRWSAIIWTLAIVGAAMMVWAWRAG